VASIIGHVQEIWSPSDRRLLTPLARATRQLIAISRPAALSLPESLSSRTTIVDNATPDPGFVTPMRDDGPLNFLIASRWNSWKGHQTLLAAWDRLDEQGHLVILGGPPPVGEAVDVPGIVSRLRHPETVSVVGEVNDASRFVEQCDVMLVPSDQPEPFGLVAIEAFARSRPVIASAAGGVADIVHDGVCGWLFPPGDVTELARLLGSLTRADVAAAGLAARTEFETRFTPEHFRNQWRRAIGLDPMGTTT
jgi:glycosyltransferase involved in cell wall biosynthesis